MKIKTVYYFSLAFSILFFTSCETEDIMGEPVMNGTTVTLSASSLSISEDGGSTEITASLSENVSSDVTVNLAFGGTATGNGADYNTSALSITIASGSLSGSLTLSTVQDTDEENNETVEVTISSATGATPDNSNPLNITIEDDDVALVLNIIVNEVLYDPSNSDLDGDANGDGIYAQSEDEFIEFINLSNQTVDMGGYMIFDSEALTNNTPRHVIPANTLIAPGKALVVFGGGTLTGSFGGATVQTSTTGDMNLNNSGDVMTLQDANGVELVTFDIEPLSNNPNESYTRNPDLTGAFEQHSDNTGRKFSPGTKIDATPF